MNAVVIGEQVRIPSWARDFDGFRRWTLSDEFPERGLFSHLDGELWVDLSPESLRHNFIRGAATITAGTIVESEDLGLFVMAGMRLVNLDVHLSTEPDGMFVSHRRLKSGLVVLDGGDDAMEVLGTPDAVMEIVSKSSVKKDTEVLRDLYWQAEIPEYWLIDALREEPELEILRFTAGKYVSSRKSGGWAKSQVFGKSFRLTSKLDVNGIPDFTLEYR